MVYRRVLPEDFSKIDEMLKGRGIEYTLGKRPTVGFVAIGDSGELVGFIFGHAAWLIEPFICENPTAGVKLNYMMEGASSALGFKISIAHIKSENEKLDIEVKRAGYEEIDSIDHKLYKKVCDG